MWRGVGNGGIGGGWENARPCTNHGLLIFERVPGKRNARSKIVLISIQVAVLHVQFVPQAVVQGEIWPNGPGVLPVKRAKWPIGAVDGIVKALLVKLRRAQGNRLQRAERRRIYACKSAVS